ncbi:WD40 domain protein [Paramyrothecium foliicola]|nr:WD40 domain protein [Paramyrothecium foliicola]
MDRSNDPRSPQSPPESGSRLLSGDDVSDSSSASWYHDTEQTHIRDDDEDDAEEDPDWIDAPNEDDEEDEFHDAFPGDIEVEVLLHGDEDDEDEDGEGENQDTGPATDDAVDEFTRQVLGLLRGGQRGILTRAQLMTLLRNQDNDGFDEEDEEDRFWGLWGRRRRRRQPKDPNRFPKVPSPEGTKLMNSGGFGAYDTDGPPRKKIARRTLERELGIADYAERKRNNDLITQSMVPNSRAEHTVHYDDPIYSGQFSDDGNFFFSCCQDYNVRMYDTSNPYNWKHYKTASNPWGQWTLTDASLSPDNKWLAYTTMNPMVSIAPTDPNDTGDPYTLDLTGGARGSRWGRSRGGFSTFSVRFSGDGRELVAGTNSHAIVVYDIESRQVLHYVEGHEDDVNAVCFADKSSPHILYSGSDDTTIKVWDRRSMGDRREAGAFVGHIEGLTYLDSKGDGRYILSNGKDQSMKLWDLRMVMSTNRFSEVARTRYPHTSGFDYRTSAYDDDDWDVHPHDNSLVTFRGHKVLRTLIRCHFSPPNSTNSRYVYSGSADGKVYIYNMDATVAGVIDVKRATTGTRQADRRTRLYFNETGGWGTLVRDASWHPSAPVLVASAWNGYNMGRGTCSLHSFNEADGDEGEPRMGRSVDEMLRPDPDVYFDSRHLTPGLGELPPVWQSLLDTYEICFCAPSPLDGCQLLMPPPDAQQKPPRPDFHPAQSPSPRILSHSGRSRFLSSPHLFASAFGSSPSGVRYLLYTVTSPPTMYPPGGMPLPQRPPRSNGLPQRSNGREVAIDFSHLRSERFSHRINQIEQIRANGVGEVVSLPQLVVCGDQSAGKSSVLEGITGIPFPRQEGLCTRFPTEIILRHAEIDQLTITTSIRPHASSSAETHACLAEYRKDLRDMAELPQIINEVSKLMKIRGYVNDGGHAFASDALRIEVSGRIGLHLSVVDLPGLISVANEEQTEEDVTAVHNMVTNYLQSSRSIILAVLQASNDMANQTIIRLAKQLDPEGERTVGIITKPDLINQGSEVKLASVAKNQANIKLKLGFFLVKNPSPFELQQGLTMEARSQRELLFFSSPAWARQGLDPERVGAQKLRAFLQELLEAHIESELPKVRTELKNALKQAEAELGAMGEARSSVKDIRSFITGLSMKFYVLLQAALDGNYTSADPEFFSKEPKSRLRAKVQKKNTEFADLIREKGARRKVIRPSPNQASSSQASTSASKGPTPSATTNTKTGGGTPAKSNVSPLLLDGRIEYLNSYSVYSSETQTQNSMLLGPALTGESQLQPTSVEMGQASATPTFGSSGQTQSLNGNEQLLVSETEMLAWIKRVGAKFPLISLRASDHAKRYYRTRGKELPGNHSAALLSELFHEQSQRWASLSEAHVLDILAITSDWITRALKRVVADVALRGHIAAILRDWMEDTRNRALAELELLLEDEKRNPLTYNHYYTDNVQQSRIYAQRDFLEMAADDVVSTDEQGIYLARGVHDLDTFLGRMETRINPNMDEQACKEAREELDAYYRVAMKTFVDNIARQVIERRILTPLNLAFCPNFVSQLDDEALLTMGAESKQQLAERQRLTCLVIGLKSSLRDIQGPVMI